MYGGTNLVLECVDLTSRQFKYLIPVKENVWSLHKYQNTMYVGLESGDIMMVDLTSNITINEEEFLIP